MVRNHLFIIIGEEHYNPLGAIRSLGESGISPIFIAIKGKSCVSSKSKYLRKVHYVNSIDEAYEVLINNYKGQMDKPFVITTDDDIQSLLDIHYEELKEDFYIFNGGKNGCLTEYMDKKKILDIAEKHGLNILKTIVVDRGEVPSDLEYPIMTKSISPNVGGWKADVHICNNEEELRRAFEHIKSPQVLLQKFIEKKNEYCLDGFMINQGKKMFVPTVSIYNYTIRGYYSPYMTVYPFTDEKIREAIIGMMSEIGFEGIFSLEFLIDGDGTYYFTEVNFRHSTWSYIGTKLGMPIPLLWAEATLHGEISEGWYKPIPDHYTAMVEPIDYGKRVIDKRISLADWLIDFKNADCPFYLDQNDPEPFYEMVNNWERLS